MFKNQLMTSNVGKTSREKLLEHRMTKYNVTIFGNLDVFVIRRVPDN
jgi:hypothetical protein